jgi:hypothetical protein
VTEKNPRAQRGSGSLVTVIVKTDITFKDAVATTMLFRTHGIAGSARARCAWPGTVVALQADAVGSVLGHFRTAWDPCLRQFDDAPHGSFRIVRRGAQGFGPTAVVEVGGVAASLLTRLTANWRGGLSPTSLLAPSRQPSQGTRAV